MSLNFLFFLKIIIDITDIKAITPKIIIFVPAFGNSVFATVLSTLLSVALLSSTLVG